MFHTNLVYYLLKKEIKSVYVGSTLGALWIILRPLLIVVVFWLVFSEIMKVRPHASTGNTNYIFFLLSTIFFWFGFQESMIRSSVAVIEKGEIVKKVSMPIEVLPVVSILVSYFNHLIGVFIFIAVVIFLYDPSVMWLLVIPITGLLVLFSMGLGFLFSALSVYVRDIPQILNIVLQGMFFLTPIVYPLEIVPEKLKFLFYINPLTYFIKTYQDIIIYRAFPNYLYLTLIIVLSIASLLIGLKTFKKLKEGFADIL